MTKIPSPPQSKGGMGRFFGGNKKPSKVRAPPVSAAPQAPPKLPENLARYLKPDGTLARTFVSFKEVARRCDTSLLETSFPLIGQKSMADSPPQSMQVGELIIHMFRLPPLPGLPADHHPQSLEECVRGLHNMKWHKTPYYEGTLTQYGGDCLVRLN